MHDRAPVPVRMWAGVSPRPGADVGRGEPQSRRRCGWGEPQSRRRCGGATTSPIRAAGHSAHSAGLQTRSLGGYCEYSTRLQILRRRQRNVLLHGLPKVVRRERLVAHLHTNTQETNKRTNARVLNPATLPPRLLTESPGARELVCEPIRCAHRVESGLRRPMGHRCRVRGRVCACVCARVPNGPPAPTACSR